MLFHDIRLAVRPIHTVRVREESKLLVGGQHIQAVRDKAADFRGEEAMPPIPRNAYVGQFAHQGAEGLVLMLASVIDSKFQFGEAGGLICQFINRFGAEFASRFKGKAVLSEDMS